MEDDKKESPSPPPSPPSPQPSTSASAASESTSHGQIPLPPPRQESPQGTPQPGPSTGRGASSSCALDARLEDLNFSEVLRTLRTLSQATPPALSIMTTPYTTTRRCPSCNNITSVRRVKSREEIIANLRIMQARGEELPSWVLAYMEGDSIKAAKLLHLSYLSSRPNGNNKRTTEEPTSTTLDEKKRKRQDSSDTDDDE